MAVTGTKTVRDIVTLALRKASILGIGETASAEDADAAREELELMLKGWQNMGYNLWTKTAGTLTLTTAASYTLSPVRPLAILSARLKRGSTEMPMSEMTRQEYDELPTKTTTGTPTMFYYDRQREAAVFYVWPVLAAANGETVQFTYEREMEDISDIGDVIDIPGEWWDAVVYNLAARMLETVTLANKPQTIFMRAEKLLRDAGAFDREGSIFMGSEKWV
jgi:hypothetical protein